MKRILMGFMTVVLLLSSIVGGGGLYVANAAPVESSVRFEETDLGWDANAFTFPNVGAIRNIKQIESSSEDDLYVIARLLHGDKWDIYHFDTDGTFRGALVDRATLGQDLLNAGATWVTGSFEFYPEKVVFSEEDGVNYLYIIHKQDETNYPMIKYNLDSKSVENPEVVMFNQPVTSIQKAYDGLLYVATGAENEFYSIDPSTPAINIETTNWGFKINSIAKLQNGKFMSSKYADPYYLAKGYLCDDDLSCSELPDVNSFSMVSTSADGTNVMGMGYPFAFVNDSPPIELDQYAENIVEINNQGTIFMATMNERPISVLEYNSESNKYEKTRTIGTSRETTYTGNNLNFVQDEKGHVFILDYHFASIDEFDESGLYIRSLYLEESPSEITYYNGLLYALDSYSGDVVTISTDDLSYEGTLWSDAKSIMVTLDGNLFVAQQNQLEQYSINPDDNTMTLVHAYPFTGSNLMIHTEDTISILDNMRSTTRLINVKSFDTKDFPEIYGQFWLDPSGLIAFNNQHWAIADLTLNILYTASDRDYGYTSFYKGNGQRMILRTFYDSSLETIRTIPVGIRIIVPSLADAPVFSTIKDELEIIPGTLVTSSTINLGINFPMNGIVVNDLTLNGTQIQFNGVPETTIGISSMPGTIYQAVIGDIGKRKAILQFNNLGNNWSKGTLQMIFSEETGEIQIQIEKNQGSNVWTDLYLSERDTYAQNSHSYVIGLQSGNVLSLFPHRTHFSFTNAGQYAPIFLQSTSSPTAPVLLSPATGTIFYLDTPEVTFMWDNPNLPGSYDQTKLLVATDPTFINVIRTVKLTNEESYTMDTSDLYAGIPYYWKVLIADTANTAFSYSDNGTFSIGNWSVSLTINSADVTKNSAEATYEILSSDLDQYTASGIAVSTSINPTISDSVYSTTVQAAGKQDITLTELLPNTTYYARAYAVTDQDTRYSDNVSFTTGGEPISSPTPTNPPPTSPPTSPPVDVKQPVLQEPVKQDPVPQETVCPFTDLEKHWAKTDVCQAASLGIIEGVEANRYAPNLEVTRTEFTVMLARALQLPAIEDEASISFHDQESIPAWARPMIKAALAEGFITGYPDGTFRPGQTITRTEMAVMLSKAMKWDTKGKQNLTFVDVVSIPAWALPYVALVYERGLIQGRGGNLFVPDGITTRAEAAVVLLRLWNTLR
ncbi:S-layer homology domain-containing protein [Paenibacillus sp. FA6]|uniref:S-layer homology domain-containing protein n=1 Tax=Paenibacillus sp. FA6 TaxID=3413029 RepID=UPI003F659502